MLISQASKVESLSRNHPSKRTIDIEGVISSEEGEPIISGPDPTTYWQEFCTVPIGP